MLNRLLQVLAATATKVGKRRRPRLVDRARNLWYRRVVYSFTVTPSGPGANRSPLTVRARVAGRARFPGGRRSGGHGHRRGLHDLVGDGLGVRDRDRVRGTGDLEGAVRARALGHVVLELGGDDVVLLADQEPRRHVLPQRLVARRFGERLLGGGALRYGHQCGLRRGDVL